MSDDEKPGKPVEKLQPDDPLNRALGSIQLTINEMASTCWNFIEEKMRVLHDEGIERVILDLKMSVVQNKLTIRRALRRFGQPQPRGNWWSLILTKDVLAEYFERIRPEPSKPPEALDVDAAVKGEPPAPRFVASELVRARMRELDALIGNVKRTCDELAVVGLDGSFAVQELGAALLDLGLARRTLYSAVDSLGETLQ